MTSPNLIINSVRRSNIKDASTVFGRFLIYEFLPSARLKKCFFVTRLFYFTTFFTLCASFPLLLAFCWHNFSTRPLPGHAVSNKCGNTLIETALNLSNYKCLYEPLSQSFFVLSSDIWREIWKFELKTVFIVLIFYAKIQEIKHRKF